MKKLFLLLSSCFLALAMQAEVYYLLPSTADNAPVQDVYSVLPWEGDGTAANVEVSPERRAYEWCKDTYNGGTAKYVTIKDVAEGKLLVNSKPAMTTLWINIDRCGLSLGDFDAMFNDNVATALGNYVKAGGNLFLSKQATRLVTKMGRACWWPNGYNSNGYFDAADEWQMCVHFCTDGNLDNPFHSCMKYLENGQAQDGLSFTTRFPLVSGEGTYRRSDNNCAWGDFGLYAPEKGGCDPERRNGIENGMGCKVLGGWGHTRGLDYAGFIEFYPQGDFKGTVMAMGLAAYQWGPQNLSEYNVKNLTKGILEYLEGSAYWGENGAPHDGKVGDNFICSPLSAYQGYHIDLVSTNTEVASFNEGMLTLHHAGQTTIKAIYTGDGKQSCKTEMVLEKTITVAPDLKWDIYPMSACVGEEGKKAVATTSDGTIVYTSSHPQQVEVADNGDLTFKGAVEGKVTITATVTIGETPYSITGELDANLPWVYWVEGKVPGATGFVGQPMAAEAKLQYGPGIVYYETTNCTWANDQLTFAALGEAKVKPYVEYYGVKYYGEEKIINVVADEEFYTRATTAGKYGTICVERNSVATEGATFFLPVAIVKEGETITGITLEEVTSLTAGQGYFFLANAAEVKVKMLLSETALTTAVPGGKETRGMHGTFEPCNSPDSDGNEMFLSNNQLWYGAGNYIGEHRAWIKMNELQEWLNEQGQQAPVAGRRRVTMAVEHSNTTTGIDNNDNVNDNVKVLVDGQLYILRAGKIYSVDGKVVK